MIVQHTAVFLSGGVSGIPGKWPGGKIVCRQFAGINQCEWSGQGKRFDQEEKKMKRSGAAAAQKVRGV